MHAEPPAWGVASRPGGVGGCGVPAGWDETANGARDMTRQRATGVLMLGLVGAWDEWVHRRIESVQLKDPLRFMRRVSLDFRYPDAPPSEYSPGGEPIVLVPLTLLRKRTLLNFSLRDETGAVLPLLTRTQNSNVAAATLAAYAELKADETWTDGRGRPVLRNRPVPLSIFEDFLEIASGDRDDALRCWERLGSPREGEEAVAPGGAYDRPGAAVWREAMATDQEFMALTRDFALNYLALTPLVGGRGQRRVIKYSYEEVIEPLVSRLRVRYRGFRARRAERRSIEQVAQSEGPRGRLTVTAHEGLDDTQACNSIAFTVRSRTDEPRRIECAFRSRNSGTLTIQLPVGDYEVRPLVPEGLSPFRPGPIDVSVGEGQTVPVEFTYVSGAERNPRTELRGPETHPRFRERIARGLGWRPKRVVVITPAIGHGGSYHFEAEAPEGLFISRAALSEEVTARATTASPPAPPLALDKNSERVHLAAPSVRQDYSGMVILKLRPRPWTIIRPAALSAIFTTAVLLTLARRWPAIGTNAGAVATLLLIVPGGLSAWAARSQENPVTTEVLFGLRLLSLAAGLWAFIGAAALVLNRRYDAVRGDATLGPAWTGTEPMLWTLFGLSALTALVLLLAWWQILWLGENRARKNRMLWLRQVFRRGEERAG